MASVRRKPGSRYFHGCYTDANGVQRQRSTKLTDWRSALKMAERWEEAYRRRVTEAQARRVISEIHEDINGRPLNDVTVRQHLANWLRQRAPEVKHGSQLRYDDAVRVLHEAAPQLGDQLIDRIDPKDLIAARDEALKTRAASTINNLLTIWRMAFRAAWEEGLASKNLAAPLKRVKRGGVKTGEGRRPFTMDELHRLLAVAQGDWRDMCLVAFYTGGQRLGDYADMRCGQVDIGARALRLTAEKTDAKNSIPLVAPAVRVLADRVKRKQRNDPVFPDVYALLRPDSNVPTANVSARFKSLLRQAGLAPKRRKRIRKDGKELTPKKGFRESSPLAFHSFRHTATSMLKNAGVSDAIARDIVGHESEAVSANYTHIDDATKRAALEKLPDLTA